MSVSARPRRLYCEDCREAFAEEDGLGAEHPFIRGEPQTCGTPTAEGYRQTCGLHSATLVSAQITDEDTSEIVSLFRRLAGPGGSA